VNTLVTFAEDREEVVEEVMLEFIITNRIRIVDPDVVGQEKGKNRHFFLKIRSPQPINQPASYLVGSSLF
jgi:hypothetical protein